MARTPMSQINIDHETEIVISRTKYEEFLRLQTAMIHASNLLEALEDNGDLKNFPNAYQAYKEKFNETELAKWLDEIHSQATASK